MTTIGITPTGLHPVTVPERRDVALRVAGREAVDGTPVIDLEPGAGTGRGADLVSGRGEPLADYLSYTFRGDVELGVAWFMVALLTFSVVYAAAVTTPRPPRGGRRAPTPRSRHGRRVHRRRLLPRAPRVPGAER